MGHPVRGFGERGHPAKQLCDTVTEIFQQIPSIGDLFGLRRALVGGIGIADGPIPAHDLDRWVLAKPCGHGLGRAIRQDVEDAVVFQIDHHGA